MHTDQFFFDPACWKYTDELTQSYDKLLAEFSQLPESVWTPSNFGYTNTLIKSDNWHFVPFITKGNYYASIIDSCPTVKLLLETVPIYDNCVFSTISGGGIVPPHTGFSNRHLRVHLGIKTDGQAWIRVGDQKKFWQERQVLIFQDCTEHEVQNPSTDSRVVFLFDIKREDYFDNLIK